MKTVHLEPLNDQVTVKTETRLLDTLLARKCNVAMACGGQGMCATCHVYIKDGMDALTPMTGREKETLSFVTGVGPTSRLACQAKVLADGVVVEVPEGMYLQRVSDLDSLIGRRAEANILHPKNGALLIEKGKIITRSRLSELAAESFDLMDLRNQSHITR